MQNAHYSCRIVIKLRLFSTYFRKKKTQISSFIEVRAVEAELFHPEGQTDRRDEINSRF